jgi:hypothetical protein
MFKTETCVSVTCDPCGNPLEYDDHIPHFNTEADAMDAAREYDWIRIRDGKVYCSSCEPKAPDCRCEDGNCDADMCLPGCPCERHEEIGPIPPCELCGALFETRGALSWHVFTHKPAPAAS